MKLVLLFTGGRSGSDLLQSLLDGHKEVAQFPAVLHFTKELLKIFKLKDPKNIAKNFISLNKLYFDSRLNKRERHDKLGKKKNEFYIVNKNLFIENFVKIFKKSKKENLDILVCLHKAYMLSRKMNPNKLRIVFLHIHLFENFRNYLKVLDVYKDTKILVTYRDPLVSMCSTVKHWTVYDEGKHMTPRNLFSNYRFHFNTFNDLKEYKNRIRVVKLENIHTKSKKTLRKICKFIGIAYSNILLKSTYFNKKWWGDSISNKNLDGLNSNFKNKFDKNIFEYDDIEFIENKIINILKKYNYPIRSKNNTLNSKFYFPLFKFEKKFYKITLEKFKFKTKLSIIFFYFKRLNLFKKKFSWKNLPNEI
tara:strand:+ start:1 stop:1089 length:1089 start_codon:yes stop_codon:yes gene_type:complete